ncbi:PLP-dependent aminotransferase family protein [Zavarzinia sp. CC-PAN008]|uniref:aminotransferase-like domain-containing protein n=1 Tax=Zavarzinia sp. CC-PAN008 TaxID=3243332 RepID=UPI003F74A2E5
MVAETRAEPDLIRLDRSAQASLAEQIHAGLAQAIRAGHLVPGARLPSWRDLAARLGVARGTVRVAYERLADEQLVVAAGSAGTRVAPGIGLLPQARGAGASPQAGRASVDDLAPLPFQMGVPAQDAFPTTVWSRLLVRASRQAASAPASYPDPRGPLVLRQALAAMLAIARGVQADPNRILITAGYAGALGLALATLRMPSAAGRAQAWTEDPGFGVTRRGLAAAGMAPVAVPVDADGIDVSIGEALAPDALLAVVTPGQQAPLGMTLSLSRRLALLDWARRRKAWVLEDDYLSELQLKGRAAPALAALDGDGRVLHAGTFSKTISPALRLGFLVVPPPLAARAEECAALLAPAAAGPVPLATAAFLAEGHYLRHVRRMKRLYAARRAALVEALARRLTPRDAVRLRPDAWAGLTVRLDLPADAPDVAIARDLRRQGLAPAPLSTFHVGPGAPRGLLLAVANACEPRLADDVDRLLAVLRAR